MGFLDIFSKKAEVLKFSQINAWLDHQVEEKKLDQKVAGTKQDISNLIALAKKSVDTLETAQLTNPHIPEKEKQIMEGHRRVYVQKMRRFLEDVKIPTDFTQVGHYTAVFSENLGKFSEETSKNYMVLKHFFENELSSLVQSVKNIEQALFKLQSDIDREGVELIREAKIKLRQYQEDYNKKEKLEAELDKETQELEMLKNKKLKIEAKLIELTKSPDYQELRDFFEEKKKMEEQIKTVEQELITLFAELNRPLKKYTHNTTHEKLVDSYIADPAGALQDDDSMTINEVMKKMMPELESLGLKDKQLENTRELIKKVNREYFSRRRDIIFNAKSFNRDVAMKINRNVIALNIAENESWLKSLDTKISEWQKKCFRTRHELEQINLDYLKQKTKEKILEINRAVKVED
jgi:hypothetical protein